MIEIIRDFWLRLFSNGSSELINILTILTVFLIPIYVLGVLKYFDALFYRISQIFVRPINLLIFFFEKSSSSIHKLEFKYHVANFIFVICSVAMLLTEYKLIQEFLESFFKGSNIKISVLVIPTSDILSISYLAIASLLGFIGFELSSSFKSVYSKVFEPENIEVGIETKAERQRLFLIFALIFFVPLLILAFIQGYIGYERELVIGGAENHSPGTFLLLVVTGFLIPIIAGIGLMSFHIFIAQIAAILTLILQLLKDLIIAICLKIIALVDFLSALITKTIILFLGVDGDLEQALIKEQDALKQEGGINIDKIKAHVKLRFLKRLHPVKFDQDEDKYSVYILDKLDLNSEYTNAFWKKNTMFDNLTFICDKPKFRLEKNFKEVFLLKRTFQDIADEIKNKQLNEPDNENLLISFRVVDTSKSAAKEKDITDVLNVKDLSKIMLKEVLTYDTFLVVISNKTDNSAKISDNE